MTSEPPSPSSPLLKHKDGDAILVGMGVTGEEQPGRVEGGSRKGCATVSINKVPAYMRGNIYVWTGYRLNFTWKDALRSILCLHNGNRYNIIVVSLVCCLSLGEKISSPSRNKVF